MKYSMKYIAFAAVLVVGPALLVVPPLTVAAENPSWAYPVAPKGLPKRDPNKIITVPGSDKKYNEVEVNNPYGPPDWFPNDHPPMPPVVANGRRQEPRACSLCHLTTGDGHPEVGRHRRPSGDLHDPHDAGFQGRPPDRHPHHRHDRYRQGHDGRRR